MQTGGGVLLSRGCPYPCLNQGSRMQCEDRGRLHLAAPAHRGIALAPGAGLLSRGGGDRPTQGRKPHRGECEWGSAVRRTFLSRLKNCEITAGHWAAPPPGGGQSSLSSFIMLRVQRPGRKSDPVPCVAVPLGLAELEAPDGACERQR